MPPIIICLIRLAALVMHFRSACKSIFIVMNICNACKSIFIVLTKSRTDLFCNMLLNAIYTKSLLHRFNVWHINWFTQVVETRSTFPGMVLLYCVFCVSSQNPLDLTSNRLYKWPKYPMLSDEIKCWKLGEDLSDHLGLGVDNQTILFLPIHYL